MKILIFLHGTSIMHRNAATYSRNKRVQQVKENEESVRDYNSYIPIGNVVDKLQNWKDQGAEVTYLSSHLSEEDIEKDREVLRRFNFPDGKIFWREKGKQYKDVVEELMPNILIEDDCESIGGQSEMAITNVVLEKAIKIISIPVQEFGGIDHLPDDINKLSVY